MNKYWGLLLFFWCMCGYAVTLPNNLGEIRIYIGNQEIKGNVKVSRNRMTWQYQDITCDISLIDLNMAKDIRLNAWVPQSCKQFYKMRVVLEKTLNQDKNVFYYDGAKVHPVDGSLNRKIPYDTLPFVCAYGQEAGIALGITPDSVAGEFQSAVATENGNSILTLSVPMVLDNLKEQKLGFILMDFIPRFGWLDALEQYYNCYPGWFKPADGINQNIYGIGGYYLAGGSQHPLQLHAGRRSKLNWEWTYAPWLEAGNWYAIPEQWQNGQSETLNFYGLRKHKKGTFEEFRQDVTTKFDVGSRRAAMYFYILVKDMMGTLADKYPGAHFVNEHGREKMISGLYSIEANRNKTYFTWTPGTGLQDYIEKELRLCAENYKIDGFAFDMANHSMDNYGSGQMQWATGRCFDEDGKIYTPDTILPVYFADYIHTLKSFRGERLSVYMNMALSKQSYLGVFHADGVMFEGGPEVRLDQVMTLRVLSGRKPMTFWSGIAAGETHDSIAWKEIKTREQKREVYKQLATMQLLKCYQLGVSPMNWAVCYDNGNFFIPHIQQIISLKKAGWNPVPAMTGKDSSKLYLGRFGYGKDTILTISNPQREAIDTRIEVSTDYFGSGDYLLLPHQPKDIRQHMERGKIEFDLHLDPKELVTFTAIPVTGSENLIAEIHAKGFTSAVIRIVEMAGNAVLSLHKYAINGMVLDSVRHNGNTLGRKNTVELVKGDSLELGYTGKTVWGSPPATIAKVFTALDQKKNNAVIVLTENPSRNIKTVGIMVDRYYPYCEASLNYNHRNWTQETGFLEGKYATVNPIQISKAPIPGKKSIIIGTITDFPEYAAKLPSELRAEIQWRRGGFLYCLNQDTIWIGGQNDQDVEEAADAYFELLDHAK